MLSHVIHVLLVVLTFGAQRKFLSHYHTVLRNTLYVPDAVGHDLARAPRSSPCATNACTCANAVATATW